MNKVPRWLMAAFAITFLVLLIGGAWFYKTQEQRLRALAEGNLQAIADLKVAQIAQWRADRLNHADEMLDRGFTRRVIARWMVSPQPGDVEEILSKFRSLQKYYRFDDVVLVDSEGRPRLSLSGRADPLASETMQALGTAFRERRSVLSELHVSSVDRLPHAETVAPLFSANGLPDAPIGAIVQQMDPRHFLYPLIHAWPKPSESAETLIVRRDGDAVLYLNELRHRKNTALTLRIPLSRTEVTSVMAVSGREGVVEGKDYRGVEVLSVLEAVPDSPWFIVAKIDKAETLANWRFLSRLIMVLILGFVIAMAAAIGMIWQHYAKAHYRTLFRSEAALRKIEMRHATTLMSIGDGVIATDAQGHVELMNPVAEALTGWSQEEALGKSVAEVFRIVNQETRHEVENPVECVLRERTVVGLANHTVLISRDGREYPISDSGAPIHGEKGEITGVVLVFSDQSEMLASMNKLRESEEKYKSLYDDAPVSYIELDCEGCIEKVNENALEMLGYTAEEMLGRHLWDFVVEEKEAEETIKAKISGKAEPDNALERTYRRKNGTLIPVLIDDRVVRNRESRITQFRAIIQDITGLKHAEEELRKAKEDLEIRVRERTAELEMRNKELQDFAFIASHDLKEPLRKVQAFGDLVVTKSGASLDKESVDYLGRMQDAAARMGELLESLLAYSRVTMKGSAFSAVNVAEAVRIAASNLEIRMKESGGSLEIGDLPTIEGDHAQLVQLFQNLLGNSLKFRREGESPSLKVHSRFVGNGGTGAGECEICVEDNGIGFDEKYLDKIFVPFQRLHGRTEYEGVGMGLAICRKIVERHNGFITAKGVPGKGSTFIVRLPLIHLPDEG